jgi:hypothetical protein
MTADELQPYLGLACSIRLACRSCAGTHVLHGTLQRGRYVDELLLEGQAFCIEDIEQVWQHIKPPRRKRGVRLWLRRAFTLGKRPRVAALSAEVLECEAWNVFGLGCSGFLLLTLGQWL